MKRSPLLLCGGACLLMAGAPPLEPLAPPSDCEVVRGGSETRAMSNRSKGAAKASSRARSTSASSSSSVSASSSSSSRGNGRNSARSTSSVTDENGRTITTTHDERGCTVTIREP